MQRLQGIELGVAGAEASSTGGPPLPLLDGRAWQPVLDALLEV